MSESTTAPNWDYGEFFALQREVLRQRAEASLLPIAQGLAIASETDTLTSFVDRPELRAHYASWHSPTTHPPKRFAALLLQRVALIVGALERLEREKPANNWIAATLFATEEVGRVHAYLMALEHTKAEHVRRGANGRRLIGATSRERVRNAALRHRGLLSRDEAASRIAHEVGKAPATVRKMLSSIFPGELWDSPNDDE